MSKKFYFGSAVAMLAMLASCSQDELGLVAEKPVSNNLAGRKEVGVVTLVNDAETRFDYVNEIAEEGDVLGLYLMDEVNPEAWKYGNELNPQDNTDWWTMYSLTNYISANYNYTYDGTRNWINSEALLNEGNYFATFPHCEEASNGRELWHQLEPDNTLTRMEGEPWVKGDRKNVYTNFENTFYVGYSRIYRRDKDHQNDGELEQGIYLSAASSEVHLVITNETAGSSFRIKKIALRKKDGSEVSTLAYVRPQYFDVVGTQQYYTDKGLYMNRFTQASARAVVTFDNIPDAQNQYDYAPDQSIRRRPAYEFSFTLPEENGFEMNASTPRLDVYTSLPLSSSKDYQKYEVVVYADQFTTRQWEPGMLTLDMTSSLSQDGKAAPQAELKIDSNTWVPYTDSGFVMDTDDLVDKIKSCKEKMASKGISSQILEVCLYSQNIEITDEILAMLADEDYGEQHRKLDITLDIKKTHTTDNRMVLYRAAKLTDNIRCASDVPLAIAADHSVVCDENAHVTIINNGTLTLGRDGYITKVTNNGVFSMSGQAGEVINFGETTAKANASAQIFHNGELEKPVGTLLVNNLEVTDYGYNCATVNVEGSLSGYDKFSNFAVLNVNSGSAKIWKTTKTSEIYVNHKRAGILISGLNEGYAETRGQIYLYSGNQGTILVTEKITDTKASVIFVKPQTQGEGTILNNGFAPIQNQPAYPFCKNTVVRDTLDNFTSALADIAAYNSSNIEGNVNTIHVTDKAPQTGTLPTYIKEAELNIDSDHAYGSLALGTAKVLLSGKATIKEGHEWVVTGENVTDNMYIVVEKGARLSGGALTADVDYNR